MDIQNRLTEAEIQFKKYHDRLRSELNNANWHFIIYKYLEKLKVEYKNEMLQATVFFGLTQRSHLFDVIMRLNKICEYNQETVNIHALLYFAEQHIDMFTDESFKKRSMYALAQNSPKISKKFLSKHRKKYATFSETNLKKLRNRVLAHIDKEVVMRDILPFKDWSVDATQIETLINDLDATLDSLSIAYDGSRYNKEFTDLEDEIDIVMDALRMGLKERETSRSSN